MAKNIIYLKYLYNRSIFYYNIIEILIRSFKRIRIPSYNNWYSHIPFLLIISGKNKTIPLTARE
jgi:hypothetical protein